MTIHGNCDFNNATLRGMLSFSYSLGCCSEPFYSLHSLYGRTMRMPRTLEKPLLYD